MLQQSNRRDFLIRSGFTLAGLSGTSLLSQTRAAAEDAPPFHFLHLTDMHVQPELRAADGWKQCIAKVNALTPRPDFIITGGDLIMDALAVDADRIEQQWTLFDAGMKQLEIPAYHVVGNHDVGGWSSKGTLSRDDRYYGKQVFADRYGAGRTYRSFNHKGWHFILLDSIGQAVDSPDYIGHIDEAQLDWLRQDLEATGTTTPIVIVTHIPFYSAMHQMLSGPTKPVPPSGLVTNVFEFRKLLQQHNVKLVLSGHGHVRERIELVGITHIQSGAVCGMWWKGPVFGDAEAFGVVTCHGDAFDYRYQEYDWNAKG